MLGHKIRCDAREVAGSIHVLTSEATVCESPLDSLPDTSSGLLSSAKIKHFPPVSSRPHRIGDRLHYSPRQRVPNDHGDSQSRTREAWRHRGNQRREVSNLFDQVMCHVEVLRPNTRPLNYDYHLKTCRYTRPFTWEYAHATRDDDGQDAE